MKFKTILLTIALAIGFSFQNCDQSDDFGDCICPPIIGNYFDINGILVKNLRGNGGCCGRIIKENDEVKLSEYDALYLECIVDFYGNNCNKNKSRGFSLMNSALACSCQWDGELGSQEEKLNSLTILTLNDFDNEHLANDTINDLINIDNHNGYINLNEYLLQDTSLMMYYEFEMRLTKAPVLNDTFQYKVIMELSTNEVYETESIPMIITD